MTVAELLANVHAMSAPEGFLHRMVAFLKPAYMLELGTGRGYSAAKCVSVLPNGSRFVTINLPPESAPIDGCDKYSGDDSARELDPWRTDPRLTVIFGDTIKVRDQVQNGVDFLFIDSDHHYAHVSQEWRLYESALASVAIVVVDDMNQNDMMQFWSEVRYEKVLMDTMGIFRYVRQK